MDVREKLKEYELPFMLSIAGYVLVFFSFYHSFELWVTLVFYAGFAIVFGYFELEAFILPLRGASAMEKKPGQVTLKMILLVSIGNAMMIMALMYKLDWKSFFLYFIGLNLILASIQLALKKKQNQRTTIDDGRSSDSVAAVEIRRLFLRTRKRRPSFRGLRPATPALFFFSVPAISVYFSRPDCLKINGE